MMTYLDPVLLARIQFAFTVSFHIIFPAFTIGLASWLVVVEWRFLKTGNRIYEDIYRMWVKIFAVTFGMGVVSGVVLSYQFGTNWSVFSDRIGNVIGPLLGFEVLTAFFLEASFLGIMLFGRSRVSNGVHTLATVLVAALGRETYDLILFGIKAIDDDSGQIGVIVAEKMGLPHVSTITHLELGDGSLTAHREIEGGKEVVAAPLPPFFTMCLTVASK